MFGESKERTKHNNSTNDFHQIIMKAIAVLTLVALALPIASMIGIFGSVNYALFQSFGTYSNSDPIEEQLKAANRNNGINSGDSVKYLKAIYEKLDSNAATIEEARLASNLNIIFADFNENAEPVNPQTDIAVNSDGDPQTLLRINRATRLINMDFKNIGNAAFVMISNRPLLLNILNQPENTFGRLGVENKSPFDLVNFEGPLLAGFRVEAFNFYKAIDPSFLVTRMKDKRLNSKLCSAIKDWQSFFDVKDRKIKVWHVTNPQDLVLKETSIKSTYLRPIRLKEYNSLCLKKTW